MQMLEKTIDPHVDIVEHTPDYVEYLADNGERWRIYGQCNLCGACYVGANDPLITVDESRVGESNAAQRLDAYALPWYLMPVRPEIAETPECVLHGEYV
jgi:hypothetical protein